jgi:hypothetical protein
MSLPTAHARRAPRLLLVLLGAVLATACDASARAGRPAGTLGDSAAAGTAAGTAPAAQPSSAPSAAPATALTSARLRHFIDLADSTEINALVIDMKDEFGLNYASANPDFARNAGEENKFTITRLRAMVDTLKAHGILPIARLVVFKDSVAARVNPQWTIRRTDGSIWRDHKGLAWVDPHNRALWDYNIGVAEELARLGFGEVQFDYIRFPEPYKSLPQQVFPAGKGQSKPDAITEFLKVANERLDKAGVRSTADIFGLVTTVEGPLEVAQHWERVAPVTDVLLPMVYPSHYPRGSLGVAHPNGQPYDIVYKAIVRARERNEKLGIRGEQVRPWLQAFSLGKPDYTAEHVRQQKQATYDAGFDGWVLWHPGSKYEPFESALERGELVSRKKR